MNIKERANIILKERKFAMVQKQEKLLENLRKDEKFSTLDSGYKKIVFDLAFAKAKNEDFNELEKKLAKAKKDLSDFLETRGHTLKDIEYLESSDHLFEEIYQDILDELIDNEIKQGITTISSFSEVKLPKSLKQYAHQYNAMYTALGNIFESYPNYEKPNVIISGSVGGGKTYAATVLKNALMKHKKADVKFLVAQELSNIFWDIHISHVNNDVDPFVAILEPEVLIIDDLGTEPQFNNITIPYLYYLITTRIDNNKPTIITTNLSAEGIKNLYGERLLTRLLFPEKTVSIMLDVPDQRFI